MASVSAIHLPSAPPTRASSPGGTPNPPFTIRRRRDSDLVPLAEVLERQQPASQYPIIWPLPFHINRFLVRAGEVAAFVAEDSATGRMLGHVAVSSVSVPASDPLEEELGPMWAAGHGGCAISDLRVICVLFTDPSTAGKGVGSALFNAATVEARKEGGKPVLDCIDVNSRALAFYEKRGWKRTAEWKNTHWAPGMELLVHLLVLPDEQ